MTDFSESGIAPSFDRLSPIEFEALSEESKAGYLIEEAYDRLKNLKKWDRAELRKDLLALQERIAGLPDDQKKAFGFEFGRKFRDFLSAPDRPEEVPAQSGPALAQTLEDIAKLEAIATESQEEPFSPEATKAMIISLTDADITKLTRQALTQARWREFTDAVVYARRLLCDQGWRPQKDGSLIESTSEVRDDTTQTPEANQTSDTPLEARVATLRTERNKLNDLLRAVQERDALNTPRIRTKDGFTIIDYPDATGAYPEDSSEWPPKSAPPAFRSRAQEVAEKAKGAYDDACRMGYIKVTEVIRSAGRKLARGTDELLTGSMVLGLGALALFLNDDFREEAMRLWSGQTGDLPGPRPGSQVAAPEVTRAIEHATDAGQRLSEIKVALDQVVLPRNITTGGFHRIIDIPELLKTGLGDLPWAARQQLATALHNICEQDPSIWDKLFPNATKGSNFFVPNMTFNPAALADTEVAQALRDEVARSGRDMRLLSSRLADIPGGITELLARPAK
ncbi:MAG: hypothetical protein RIQ56_699 [Candidatus Parcubacteria bacterium]